MAIFARVQRVGVALAVVGLLCCLESVRTVAALELMDGAGRRVEVPAPVMRVFPAGPPAGLVLYSLVPERLLGWTRTPAPEALVYLGPHADKPSLGWLGGRGGDANLETLLRFRSDLVVDVGMTSGTYVSLAERVQGATGVPVLLLDGHLAALPASYRTLGRALGVPALAEARAAWIENRLRAVTDGLARVPEAARPKVYLARGTTGLESARAGAINVEAVEAAGGRNVVGEALGGGSLVTVSMEQLLRFDPDVIVVLDPALFARMGDDPLWGALRAVREGKVVLTPQLPFPWVDYPPSVNRVMGVIWLAQLLFPAQMRFDIPAEARDFYRLFYHHTLSGAELDALLAKAAFR
ncbi:ABC transporter substrate-binding protein [Xanthobacter sp. ZOL 2024]